MILHNLKIENITSLKGAHCIDFDKILKTSDLFAITGPTGSGKSSILTSISLALYGKGNKTLNSADYVTQGQKEGKVSLLFSVGQKTYRANWNCSVLKRNGEPKKNPTPQREILEDGVRLDANAEEILNLNFDQFSKTIILNQGEFNKFLNSSFKERKEILENLYNGEQLTNLNKTNNKLLKEWNNELELTKAKSDGPLVFTEEEVKLKKQIILTKESEIDSFIPVNILLKDFSSRLNEIVIALNKKKESLTKRTRYENELENITITLNKKKNVVGQAKKQHEDLKNHNKVQMPKLREALRESEALLLNEASHNELKLDLDKTESLLKSTEINSKNLNDNVAIKNLELNEIKSYSKEWTNNYFESMTNAIEIFRKAKESLSELLTTFNTLKKQSSETRELLESKQKELSVLKNQKTKQLLPFKDLKQIEIEESYEFISKNSLLINDLTEKNAVLTKLLSTQEAEHLQSKKKLITSSKNNQSNTKENDLKIALEESKIELKSYKKAINSCLIHLEVGDCPVCQKQISKEELLSLKNKITQEAEILESETLDILKSTSKELETQSIQIKEQINNSENNFQSESKRVLKEIDSNTSKLKSLSTTSLLNDEQYSIWKESKKEINLLLQSIATIEKEISNLSNIISKIEEETGPMAKAIEKKQNEFNLQKIDFGKSLFYKSDDVFENFKNEKDEFLKYTSIQKDILNLSNQIKLLGNTKLQASAKKEADLLRIDSLESKIKYSKDLIHKNCKDNSPKEEITTLEKNMEKIFLELENLSKEQKTLELKRESITGLLLHIKDTEESSANIFQIELTHVLRIKNELDFSHGLFQEDSIHELFKDFKRGLSGITESINQDAQAELLFFYENVSLPFIALITDVSQNLKDELLELNTEIEVYNKSLKEKEKYAKQIQNIQNKIRRTENLGKVLGKDEFRGFALGIIERHLITRANFELKELCDGRYELEQIEKKMGMDFYIIDHWNGGLQRKVSTLSGGETFLVSLGLALALAEMTRGQAEVDSFFIDEGFGTLDTESIDEVLEVFLGLRSRGKQIGIISHVKEITDRIPINIVLEKSHTGESQIQHQHT